MSPGRMRKVMAAPGLWASGSMPNHASGLLAVALARDVGHLICQPINRIRLIHLRIKGVNGGNSAGHAVRLIRAKDTHAGEADRWRLLDQAG